MNTKPQSATELFDKILPLALTKSAEKARAINATYCFKITGAGAEGGTWSVDCTVPQPTCKRGEASPPARCTITVSAADFGSILKDTNAAMQLYFQGRLSVSGDPMLAMKLQDLFALLP